MLPQVICFCIFEFVSLYIVLKSLKNNMNKMSYMEEGNRIVCKRAAEFSGAIGLIFINNVIHLDTFYEIFSKK